MPTATAAATPAQQVIQLRKHPKAIFLVIVQTFNQQLALSGEAMPSRNLDQMLVMRQAVFAQTIVLRGGQKGMCFGRNLHLCALAIGHISYFAGECSTAPWATLFFVFCPRGFSGHYCLATLSAGRSDGICCCIQAKEPKSAAA